MVKQTSHVNNRSHESASHCMIHIDEFGHFSNRSHKGACHCMIHMSDLKTLKFTGIAAPIEELIIEQQRKKKTLGAAHQTVFVISALERF